MDAKLIEKLDRQRYWAVILQAVALFDIFAETLLWYFLHLDRAGRVLNISGIVGLPLLLGAVIWYLVIQRRINRSKELKAALNNEMYSTHRHRAQSITLWVVMCTMLATFLIEEIGTLPTHLVCEVIFLLGLVTQKTAWLILNRNRR